MADLDEALAPRVQEVVSEVFPGDFVIRWALVGEVVDAGTGKRAFVSATHLDATPPDTVGLLQHALNMEAAAVVASALDQD